MKRSFVNGNKEPTPKMSSNQKRAKVIRTTEEKQQLLKSYEKLKQDEPLISFRKAETRLSVPKSSLCEWANHGVTSKPLNQTPVFYALLEQWALQYYRKGKKCTLANLREKAIEVRKRLPEIERNYLKKHTFSNSWASPWLSKFRSRHKIENFRKKNANIATTNTLDSNLEFLGTQTDAQGAGKDATVVRRLEDVIKKQSEEMKRLQAQLDDRNQEKDQTIQKLKAEVRNLREQCASNMEALAKKEQELSVLRSVETTNVTTTKSNRPRKRRRRQQSQDVSRELSPSERKERRRQMLQALYNWNPMQRVEEVSSNDF